MPRARNIKPSIMDNEELADLQMSSRLLFIYLWMLADREGRLEDRPRRIAAQAFPYDREEDVEGLLEGLERAGFLHRYEAKNVSVIQIVNFTKHQAPHVREKASELPEPEKAVPRQCKGSDKASPRSPDSLIPDSSFLIPDSLIPDCLALQGLHAPPQIDIQAPHPDHAKPALAVLTTPPFDRFWQAYPRKTNKHEAKKAFAKTNANVDELITDVQQRLACGHWSTREKNFIPHASTYLNQRRWEDEIVTRETPMDSQSVATRTDALLREIDSGGFQ